MDKAEEIATEILTDVTNRRGWRQEYDGFDDDVRDEIFQTWVSIIRQVLESEGK